MNKKWSEEELKVLNDISISSKKVAQILKRTYDSVVSKRTKLKIMKPTFKYWTDDEIKLLYNLKLDYKQLSKKMNRNITSIQAKCAKLHINRNIKKKWSKDEIEFLYDTSLNLHDLSKLLNRSINSINNKSNSLGISRKEKLLWKQKELDILNNKNLSYKELSKILDKKYKTIVNKCAKLNLQRQKWSKKYLYNNFFKQWSSFVAFVLGEWWADGNIINNPGQYRFSITSKDYDWIETIRQLMGVKKLLVYNKRRQAYTLFIFNKEAVQDIINLGGVPNKSLVAKPPKNIPDEYILDFIAGYICGDGWISISKTKYYPTVGIVGTKEMSLWFHSILGKPNEFHLTHPERNTNTWTTRYYAEKAQKIVHQLFLDNPKSYHLQRKVKKAKQAMKWKRNHTLWTQNEIDLLYNTKLSNKKLSKKISKSINSIQRKRHKLKIKQDNWSKNEIELLYNTNLSMAELSIKLNRTYSSISHKCNRLGIKRKTGPKPKNKEK